jgi:hypothetical protein
MLNPSQIDPLHMLVSSLFVRHTSTIKLSVGGDIEGVGLLDYMIIIVYKGC